MKLENSETRVCENYSSHGLIIILTLVTAAIFSETSICFINIVSAIFSELVWSGLQVESSSLPSSRWWLLA